MLIFEELETTILKLYKYCLKLSGSTPEAEDLVQETLLKAYSLMKSKPGRNLSMSFLYTTAKNLFIDGKRKSKDVVCFHEEYHSESYDFTEYDSLLECLFTVLPLKQAMLLTLKDVYGYSSKEIASMLRISDTSVKTALHRARNRLMKGAPYANSDKQLLFEITNSIKESNTLRLFQYYRLLETKYYSASRNSVNTISYVVDPDGNVLEIIS
ncbi:RNA polymerase sigma factor [Rossellomorea aquimaris]|uniref:RNA polymerase sigma factor n=1 Tax=Rossellomorea aquimaris TaxID=189382 RepID=UPI0021CCD944|nr:RNA polymerase sigma factor [Rossellomorea aquimaris]